MSKTIPTTTNMFTTTDGTAGLNGLVNPTPYSVEYRDAGARIGKVTYRDAVEIAQRDVDVETRTVDIAFSSDAPIERFFGNEILSHDRKAVRLDRINNGGALLMDHNPRDQVGVVEDARVDQDGKGRALVRFSKSARGEEIFQDVIDGIRTQISVGFRIYDEDTERGKAGGPDTVRITDWEPLELSFVSIPADVSVGVGRSDSTTTEINGGHTMAKQIPAAERHEVDPVELESDEGAGADLNINEEPTEQGRSIERLRIDDRIRSIGKQYSVSGEVVDEAIDLEASLAEFQSTVRELRKNVHKPVIQAPAVAARGDVPILGGAPRYSKRSLAVFRGDEAAAYTAGNWVLGTIYGDEKAKRWCAERGVGRRDLAGGVFTTGGALVPEEMASTIIDLREQFGIMRQCARVMPMGSDVMTIPRRTGSGTASWTGEGAAITQSTAAFDNVELVAKKLAALSLISTELTEDSMIDIAAYVAEDFAQVVAEAEDDAYLNGDGTSTYGGIVGIRVALIDGTHTAGAVDAASANDTYAEVTQADLDSVMAVLPAYALTNAAWLCSQAGKALVFDSLAAAAGGTTMMMLGDRPQAAHLGYPIKVSQKMPTSTGDLSDVCMVLFGDFARASTVGDRRGFNVQVLNELYAASDQIGVKVTERLDIVTHDLGDTSTAGPVVGLIGE